MPSLRRENVRHATFLFCALGGRASLGEGAGDRRKNHARRTENSCAKAEQLEGLHKGLVHLEQGHLALSRTGGF